MIKPSVLSSVAYFLVQDKKELSFVSSILKGFDISPNCKLTTNIEFKTKKTYVRT